MTAPTQHLTVLFALAVALLCAACGGSERSDLPETSSSTFTPSQPVAGQPSTDDVATGACDMGESRDCRVWLPTSGGVKHCFVGTQVCADDLWSDCLSDEDAADLLGD